MICPKCGTVVNDGVRFCPACDAVMPASQTYQQPQYQQPQYQQPQYQQPQYQQPQYQQPQYQQPQYQQPQYQAPQQPQYQQPQYQAPQQPQYQPGAPLNQTPALGMGWFKFLIYFALFASAVLNAANAIRVFGEMSTDEAKIAYELVDGAQALDMILAIGLLGMACLAIFARVRLAGYYKNGPTLLNSVYLGVAAIQLINVVGLYMILPEEAMEYYDFSGNFSNMAMSIAMVAANTTYFKKRAHLFVKE